MTTNNSPQSEHKERLDEMPLLEHLGELRTRLLYSVIIITVGALLAFSYAQEIFSILAQPYFIHFPEGSMIGTGPAEAFVIKLKVSIFASLCGTSPLLFHQLWLFVSPGLYDHEKKMVLPFITSTTGLFLLGTWLCHVMILPVTYGFFESQYSSIGVTPQIRVSEHLALALRALIGFGLAFETPVLTFFLARFGFVTHTQLIGWMRYAIVVIFLIAAILTPTPDIMTQSLFAIPLIGLYCISILVAKCAQPEKQTEETESSTDTGNS